MAVAVVTDANNQQVVEADDEEEEEQAMKVILFSVSKRQQPKGFSFLCFRLLLFMRLLIYLSLYFLLNAALTSTSRKHYQCTLVNASKQHEEVESSCPLLTS